MPQQQLCLVQLTCPLTLIVLRDGRQEVARAILHVANDAAWTLEEDVRLFTRLPILKKGLLVWCAGDYTEVFSVAWEKAVRYGVREPKAREGGGRAVRGEHRGAGADAAVQRDGDGVLAEPVNGRALVQSHARLQHLRAEAEGKPRGLDGR